MSSSDLSNELFKSVLLIAIAVIIGYYQSIGPIYLFNRLVNNSILLKVNWIKNYYKIENLGFEENYKLKLIDCIKINFNLGELTNDQIINSTNTFELCNQFVLKFTNEHSYLYARRVSSFSLFSAVLWIPLSLLSIIVISKIAILNNLGIFTWSALLFIFWLFLSFYFFLYNRKIWCKFIYNFVYVLTTNKRIIND